MICVPGGNVIEAMQDKVLVANIRRLALGARYVTSVCNGSLILGAAGLLQGKRSACHWAYRDLLPIFGAVPDAARVVRDSNFISGGVTAGIGFAPTLAAELTDEAPPGLSAALRPRQRRRSSRPLTSLSCRAVRYGGLCRRC